MTVTGKRQSPESIRLLGGSLCLDFANSVDWSDEETELGPETDALRTPADLGRWSKRLGVGGARPDEGELAAARELRRALYRIFCSKARGDEPRPRDLAILAESHAEAAASGRLVADEDAVHLTWSKRDRRRVRFAVAEDAVALLADPERLARVHRCPGRRCGWLFLDTSGRRRWCTMATCGSREKMRRLYARQHAPA